MARCCVSAREGVTVCSEPGDRMQMIYYSSQSTYVGKQ